LLLYIARADSPAAPAEAAPVLERPEPVEPLPALVRKSGNGDAPPAAEPRAPRLTVTGHIVRFDCLGTVARMHVKTGEASQALLLRNPEQVEIRNSKGRAVNMTCGEQSTPVMVEYEAAADQKHATIGDVRSIEFLNR
jgi:hypothetical protein